MRLPVVEQTYLESLEHIMKINTSQRLGLARLVLFSI